MRKKVVVAMSGGVDSSTSLGLLKEQGYDCVGVSMQLWDYSKKDDPSGATSGSCCSLDDINDARRVAERLDVPFYVMNMEEAFSKEVIEYFIKGYSEGTTPNPCIKCNQALKFEVLLKKAIALEADYLATGHYARIARDGGRPRLLKGIDTEKDQSYFLFTMTHGQLERVIFPVGGLTKKEVRAHARRLGLKTSEKEESQEICFVEEPGYAGFLSSRIKAHPGDIVDPDGRVLGSHSGLFNYTIGQRKGLGLSGGPFYVIDIDTRTNRLIVGPSEALLCSSLVAHEINWIDHQAQKDADTLLSGIDAKIRYGHAGARATVRSTGNGRVKVSFEEPQKAITPGQAVVFYKGEEVLGGGWIEKHQAEDASREPSHDHP